MSATKISDQELGDLMYVQLPSVFDQSAATGLV